MTVSELGQALELTTFAAPEPFTMPMSMLE